MLYVYLYAARYLLLNGYKRQAADYLLAALTVCNKAAVHDYLARVERKHVMRALNHARSKQTTLNS